jgi:hypothetical protein
MKELLEGLPRVDVLGCLVLMFGAAGDPGVQGPWQQGARR